MGVEIIVSDESRNVQRLTIKQNLVEDSDASRLSTVHSVARTGEASQVRVDVLVGLDVLWKDSSQFFETNPRCLTESDDLVSLGLELSGGLVSLVSVRES